MRASLSTFGQFIVNLAWHKLIWLVMLLTFVTVALVNFFAPQSLPADPVKKLERLQAAREYRQAEIIYEQLLAATPLDIDLNYDYIVNHFASRASYSDSKIEARYKSLASKSDSADLGNYGLGLIRSFQKKFSQALEYYGNVKNPSQKYLNNSMGRAFLDLGQYDQAELSFRKEIEENGNVQGAVGNLANLYFRRRDANGLASLARGERTAKFFGFFQQRALAFLTGDIPTYLRLILITEFQFVEPYSALMALLVCAMYFVYLWRVDIFEQEPFGLMLLVLLLGGIAAQASAFGYDAITLVSSLKPNANWQNDIPYFILHVGLVEETVKFLAVLLIAKLFSRHVNEPVDYIIYGSLAALGFATVENSFYFSAYGIDIALGRFLVSTMAHMAMTSIVCFAWAYARSRQSHHSIVFILAGLAMAAVVHGLFDALLEDKLSLVGMIVILILAIFYRRMMKRFLKLSPFFKMELSRADHLHNFALMLSTAIIILAITFVYDNFSFSIEIANSTMAAFIFADAIPAAVIFTALGNLNLARKAKTVPVVAVAE